MVKEDNFMSPQQKVLCNAGLFELMYLEVERILCKNKGNRLTSHQIYLELGTNVRQQLHRKIVDIKNIKLRKGLQPIGGFYEEASFAGVVAAIVEQNNDFVRRNSKYCPIRKKKSPSFYWIQ
jgi:hypothetical protein